MDLAVPEGTVLGLLGPNGAGTTTAVRILTTLLRPDGGGARVAGCDVAREAAALRARIGLAGQYAAVDALRALWIGAPAGNSIWGALAWCAGLILVFGALAVDRHRRAALR